jgi:hypothetical protein
MSEFDFVKTSVNPQTVDETLMVATYELGKVIECHHYTKRYGIDSSTLIIKGYKNHGKSEVADLISMIRMYCQQQDWNYEELVELGEERYKERMDDLKLKGLQDKLKKEYQ